MSLCLAPRAALSMAATWRVAGSSLAAAVHMVFMVVTTGPAWQVYDDVYFAMILEGFGIVPTISADVPFMHPTVGMVAAGLSAILGASSYAAVVFVLLWIVLTIILNVANRLQKILIPVVLVCLAV